MDYKKLLWQPTGGYWLFWASVVYFSIACFSTFIYRIAPLELIQAAWVVVISMPLWFDPVKRRLK